MLNVASQSSEPPYLAQTIGPLSHSPAPIAEAPATRPGPTKTAIFFQLKTGGAGSSPPFQRGIRGEPGCGGVKPGTVGGGSCESAMGGAAKEGGRDARSAIMAR